MIRLFIVDEQPKALAGLLELLVNFESIVVVGTAASGEEAIGKIATDDLHPDIVILDLCLPQMNRIQVIKRVKEINSEIEVLVFTIDEEHSRVINAIGAGASGYILKGMKARRIYETIIDVHQGGTVIQPILARRLLENFSLPQDVSDLNDIVDNSPARSLLTIRENEIFLLIAKGMTNKEASRALKLTSATIRTHVEHIYRKLDVGNRVGAIVEGIRRGIIEI